jgi:hypothetical protein
MTMHIILGDQITETLEDKYIMLELDSFQVASKCHTVSAWCLVENVPLSELPEVERYRDLHAQLIRNYRLANWKFCEDALEHLQGRWNGEVDTFYHELAARITDLRDQQIDASSWDPAIKI